MPGPRPIPINLTSRQHAILEQLLRRQTSTQRLVRRVKIVLEVAKGANNLQAAWKLDLNRGTVSIWRVRWLVAAPRFEAAEAEGVDDKTLTELIEAALDDEPRPGAPGVFTPEQVTQIIALACEDPQASGRPIDRWTPRELVDEAVKRKIVASISPRSVDRFLKSGRTQAPS